MRPSAGRRIYCSCEISRSAHVRRMRTCIFLLAGAVIAAPAHAAGGTPIPEPSNMALFGLGLTGLIVGRMIARRKQNQQDD